MTAAERLAADRESFFGFDQDHHLLYDPMACSLRALVTDKPPQQIIRPRRRGAWLGEAELLCMQEAPRRGPGNSRQLLHQAREGPPGVGQETRVALGFRVAARGIGSTRRAAVAWRSTSATGPARIQGGTSRAEPGTSGEPPRAGSTVKPIELKTAPRAGQRNRGSTRISATTRRVTVPTRGTAPMPAPGVSRTYTSESAQRRSDTAPGPKEACELDTQCSW
jgi:hypothetical protein